MLVEAEGICLDYCRQKVTKDTMAELFGLAKAAGVESKKKALFAGAARLKRSLIILAIWIVKWLLVA